MRIGLFPLWTGSQIGGIATYDTCLLPALARSAPGDEFHVYSPRNDAIRGLAQSYTNVTHHRLVPRSRWINVPVSFPIATAFSRVELLHVTHVPPPISTRPYVMTLHCMSTFRHPEFYPRGLNLRANALLKKGLRSARRVICVSHGLKEIAAEELGVERERLAVVYHGVSDDFRPMPRPEAAARVRAAFGIDRPFLLFVGVFGPKKNLGRLVDAYARFKNETRSSIALVLAGRRWLTDDVDEAVARNRLEADVIQPGHVGLAALPALYNAAEALVFPSLCESFGMPVIESMACGTPVVTSRGSCLPEVAGDAAVLVDEYAVESIAEGIDAVVNDPARRSRMRESGLGRARSFTWKAAAEQTLSVYRGVLD